MKKYLILIIIFLISTTIAFAVETSSVNISTTYTDLLIHTIGGNTNFFAGVNAGNLTLTGTTTTGVGNNALNALTSGTANSAFGYNALASLTTGLNNTGIGYSALSSVTTAQVNTAVGESALFGVTTGNNNTGIGNNAGTTITTGTTNVFIGANADASANNLTNATAIGADAIVGASNSLVLGGTGANAVSVGIGTTTPWRTLSVTGTMGVAGLTNSTGDAICITASNEIVYNSGQTSCVASSKRFKHDIESITGDYGLTIVNKLRPVSFKRNSDNKEHIGLIAEEVEKVEPRLVGKDKKGKVSGVHYEELTAALIKAIQELSEKNILLEKRIKNLEDIVTMPQDDSFWRKFFF